MMGRHRQREPRPQYYGQRSMIIGAIVSRDLSLRGMLDRSILEWVIYIYADIVKILHWTSELNNVTQATNDRIAKRTPD